MSSPISRGLGFGRSHTKATEQSQGTRKRSNTRTASQPPPLQLHPPASQPVRSASSNHESRSRSRVSPSSSASPNVSSASPASRSMKYGTQDKHSPLTLSPEALSSFSGDITSSSLPATLSALAADEDMDLVYPPAVPYSRQPPSPRKVSCTPFPQTSSSSLSSRLSSANLRVHTAHSTSRSAPISRKPSAASIDRDAGLHLDMKRLLSKPAQPSHSGSSILSMPSDPEPSSAASNSPRHPRSFSQQVQQTRRYPDISPSRRPSEPSALQGMSSSQQSQTRTLRPSPSRISLQSAEKEAGGSSHKARSVLRRKTSARSNPPTPTAATFKAAAVESPASLSSSRTTKRSDAGRSRSAAPRRAASATAATETSSLAYLRQPQEPPPHLTPAGAVVHAYKQQEQRREHLAEMSGSNEQVRPQKTTLRDGGVAPATRSQRQQEEDEEGGVYYTVLGSSVGKVVALGSAEDSKWDVSFDQRLTQDLRTRPSVKAHSSSSSSPSVPSRLGRKISGRFKKSAGGVIRHGNDQTSHEGVSGPFRQPDEPYDGRPSLSERRSISSPPAQTSARAPSSSIDGYVDVAASAIPSVQNGATEKTKSRTLRTVKSLIGKEKDVEKEKEASPAGKFQKLIKRFSSGGGLRDRYTREDTPPPVPALPQTYQHLLSSRTTFDIKSTGRDSFSEMGVARFMQGRVSMSAVRPSTAPHHTTPRKEAPGSRPSTGPRPSTTTRSSSPMSSDMASTRFFPKSQSTRSSISSYGAELPPLPAAIGQYIMPPSELNKLNKESEEDLAKRKASGRSRSMVVDSSPADDDLRPSLPPPRRHEHPRHNSSPIGAPPSPSSPTIPSFNVDEPVNNFLPSSLSRLSLPTSEFGIMEDSPAPPRPPRSSRRKPPTLDIVSPTASTLASPPMPTTPRTPVLPRISVATTRPATAGELSPQSNSHEGVYSSPASSNPRSPARFRPIESPQRPLTDAEKKARWDDLLMRSEQAGGTLHIGESGLMSDNIRFSEYSDL
ncbi:hypothetical protein BDW22DRAFT_1221330 [Trametopsis cervina]|nr:hypothetical protein BDW22DRAFT_1221330 [Trametopsis cervina]